MRTKIHRNSKRPLYLSEIASRCQLCNGWFAEEELIEEICNKCQAKINEANEDIYCAYQKGQ